MQVTRSTRHCEGKKRRLMLVLIQIGYGDINRVNCLSWLDVL